MGVAVRWRCLRQHCGCDVCWLRVGGRIQVVSRIGNACDVSGCMRRAHHACPQVDPPYHRAGLAFTSTRAECVFCADERQTTASIELPAGGVPSYKMLRVSLTPRSLYAWNRAGFGRVCFTGKVAPHSCAVRGIIWVLRGEELCPM